MGRERFLNIPEVPAFKEKLKPSPYDSNTEDTIFSNREKLFEFEKDDRYIIRKASEIELGENDLNIMENAQTLTSLYRELRDIYHIEAPVQFIIAQDTADKKNDRSLFILTEHIRIQDLNSLAEDARQRALQEYAELWNSLLSYYEAKAKDDTPFLFDISDARQYVYGVRPNHTEACWYLVDTDPFFSVYKNYLKTELRVFFKQIGDIKELSESSREELRNRCKNILNLLEETNLRLPGDDFDDEDDFN